MSAPAVQRRLRAAVWSLLGGPSPPSSPPRGAADQHRLAAVTAAATLTLPPRGAPGDWATAAPLRLAAPAGRTPGELAAELARRLRGDVALAAAEPIGPGAVCLTLSGPGLAELIADLLEPSTGSLPRGPLPAGEVGADAVARTRDAARAAVRLGVPDDATGLSEPALAAPAGRRVLLLAGLLSAVGAGAGARGAGRGFLRAELAGALGRLVDGLSAPGAVAAAGREPAALARGSAAHAAVLVAVAGASVLSDTFAAAGGSRRQPNRHSSGGPP